MELPERRERCFLAVILRRASISFASPGGISRQAQCFAWAVCQEIRWSTEGLGGMGCFKCHEAFMGMSVWIAVSEPACASLGKWHMQIEAGEGVVRGSLRICHGGR